MYVEFQIVINVHTYIVSIVITVNFLQFSIIMKTAACKSNLHTSVYYSLYIQYRCFVCILYQLCCMYILSLPATTTPVWLPVVIVLVLLALIFGIAMVVCYNWLKRKHNHKLQKAKDALSQVSPTGSF